MFLRQRFTTGPNILSYSLNATGKLESYIESTAAATLNGDCCDFFLNCSLVWHLRMLERGVSKRGNAKSADGGVCRQISVSTPT